MTRWGRAGLPPGRLRLLMDHLTAGLNPSQAARAAGVSPSYAYLVHHKMGGVYRPPGVTYSARYLDREERYELARLRECGLSVRRIAARMGRSPSTVSRELARNGDARTGGYQPERAHRLAWERQRRPKGSRLSQHPVLRAAVQQMLDQRYSPEQASGRLRVLYPGRGGDAGQPRDDLPVHLPLPAGRAAPGTEGLPADRAGVRRRRGRRENRGRISARCRSGSGRPRSRAGSCPVTTKAT